MSFITDEQTLENSVQKRLKILYGKKGNQIALDLIDKVKRFEDNFSINKNGRIPYSHKDAFLITYGDSLKSDEEQPLLTLAKFADEHLNGIINSIHILPFFPYSSDDGFSVIDYKTVRTDLGSWQDIEKLSQRYKVMADLVINHVSAKSEWFKNFIQQVNPGKDYFHVFSQQEDLSNVVRPRSTPVLTPVRTKSGLKHVWTTFSPDQVDVNFENPDVLLEYLDILLFYFSKGVKIIRLDAVAFLWKKVGTNCIHLPETHEVVKLIRDVAEYLVPDCVIITETNVPHEENISYFGNGDEAHMVYNFSLPPLLYHAILTENASYLSEWSKLLTPPPEGCTYFNFAASHDGIGVRPLEGLVPHEEFLRVVRSVYEKGGQVSYKQNPNGIETPYELNITYFDSFKNINEPDQTNQIKRFFCSQILMLSFRGVPAIYIHSLLGTANYVEGVEKTGVKRTVNRKKLDYNKLNLILNDPQKINTVVFYEWKRILQIRTSEKAFHPQGGKKVLSTPKEVFAMTRTSLDSSSAVLIVGNVTSQKINFEVPFPIKMPVDLLSKQKFGEKLNSLTLEPWQVLWVKYNPEFD